MFHFHVNPEKNAQWFKLKGTAILIVLVLLASTISQASSSSLMGAPNLVIPASIPANPGVSVPVSVSYTGGGAAISALVFSINFDETLLSFDPADKNGDTVPDAVHFTVPPSFSPSVTYDANDTNGELDFIIADFAPPLATLPDGMLVTVDFTPRSPAATQTASIAFSNSPEPSFGSTAGQSVAGSWQDGSVLIKVGDPQPGVYLGYLPMLAKIIPTATPIPTITYTPTATPTITRTPTKTPLPSSCSEMIVNGGFETSSGWSMPATEYTAGYSNTRFHTGARSGRAGILVPADNRSSYSSMSQTVSISSSAKSATFTYWLYPISSESLSAPLSPAPSKYNPLSAALANDAQYVVVLDQYGEVLETLMWQRSDSQSWEKTSQSLLNYAGRSITLYFGVFNDGWGGVTSMYVDDVSLTVCR